jgi:hypothetical protein
MVCFSVVCKLWQVHECFGILCLDGADTAIALRCVPDSNSAMDISHEFRPAHNYQSETAYQSARYLDCDMYYKDPQLNVTIDFCVCDK